METLNLARDAKVPADATVVVMAGPTTEPFAQEMQFINDFLNGGGGVLLMVDPSPSPGLESFAKGWGVTVE